jgi:hypothetical protein
MQRRRWVSLGLSFSLLAGCRCAEDPTTRSPGSTEAVATLSRQEQPAGRTGCEVLPATYVLRAEGGTTNQAASAAPAVSGEETFPVAQPEDLARPFGVEMGAPVVDGDRLWLPFAQTGDRGGRVGVVDLRPALVESRLHAWEGVSAEAGPPRVAPIGERLIVALPFASAKSRGFRLGEFAAGELKWGRDVADPGAPDDSTAFDLKVAEGNVGLVWDTWDSKLRRGKITGVFFAADAPSHELGVREFAATSDAESPRLLSRPGGFWLTWIARSVAQAPAQRDPDSPEVGPESYVVALPLSNTGSPAGNERAVTPLQGFAQSYDLATSVDGGFFLTWRDEPGVTGVEGGAIYLAEVTEHSVGTPVRVVTPGEIAGTAPSLVFDSNPSAGAPRGWLSIESDAGATWLGALGPSGVVLSVLHGDEHLGAGTVLGVSAGELLVAEPRRQDLEVRRLRCTSEAAVLDAGVPRGNP